MVNYHLRFRQLLLDVLEDVEVYYEAFDEKTKVPCVSYLEANNTTTAKGTTLKYSNLSYQISIWTETVEELISLSDKIDAQLENNGFTRTSSLETRDDRYFRKIIRYDATGIEKEAL